MPRELHTAPEADADLAAAFAWYEKQRSGLGSEFLAEIARTFGAVEQDPEQYRIVRGVTRRALVHRFPYLVYYVVEADLIGVTAIMHARRDPQRWQERADV